MPTITPKPQWNVDQSREGYSPLNPRFSPQQIGDLAKDLRCTPEQLEKPLSEAALAIGPYLSEWSGPAAAEKQQLKALDCLAADAESLLQRVRGLDRR